MSKIINEMSEGFAEVVESLEKSVIRVEGRRRLPASGIVWSVEGVIVTAHHVLEREKDLVVGLPDGTSTPAELIGRDPSTDLAALRVEMGDFKPPNWTELESLQVGHLVLALGRPGRSVQAALGIVSALGEGWQTPTGGKVDRYLQTDVVMYPGFSGGPLVSVSGEVLGLNTSALRGVSVAIPTTTIGSVVDSLLSHGRVRRGYLGVGLQPVRLPTKVGDEIDQEFGLMVVSVEAKIPADRAGMILGDTILTFNSEPIRHMDDLMRSLSSDIINSEATIRLLRGGELMNLDVKIGEK